MSMELPRWEFGDVSREEFEDGKADMICPDDLLIGSNYTFRFRRPPIGNIEYIADYPVQVADLRPGNGFVFVEFVYTETKDESWKVDPQKIAIDAEGMVIVENPQVWQTDEQEKIPDIGYILPSFIA
jgi:hypothetical protein